MKLLGLSVIFILTIVTVLGSVLYMAPFYLYKQVLFGKLQTEWYFYESNKKELKESQLKREFHFTQSKVDDQLWKNFHLKDLIVPLPYRNPFYIVAPNLTYQGDSRKTQLGLNITTTQGKVLNEVYFFPKRSFPNYTGKQKLFELPYFREVLQGKSASEIFHDVFTKDLTPWKISYDEMMYNLYLAEFRRQFILPKVKSFGAIKNSEKYFFEVQYWDEDYSAFLIFHLRGKQLFSALIVSRKADDDASKIREKLIYHIDYLQSSPAITDILLKEFRALPFRDQNYQPGMLYLFSAWTHSMDNKVLFEYLIKIQERGSYNQIVLKNFYEYSYARYGEVLTTRDVGDVGLSSKIELSRKMKIEKSKEVFIPKIEKKKNKSIEEEYEDIIERTKPKKTKNQKKIHID